MHSPNNPEKNLPDTVQDMESASYPENDVVGPLPKFTGAVVSLVWAGLGPMFMAESGHFGPGFLPMLVWLLSVPVIGLVLLGATVYKVDSYLNGTYGQNASLGAVALWPVALCVYFGIGVYWLFSQ